MHWTDVAKMWEQVGPPLRPCEEDVRVFSAAVCDCTKPLILGVTPELYRLPWPEGVDLRAVDHTPAMIKAVWPGPEDAVSCGEWTELPFEDGSRDAVLCDGGLHLLAYPDGQASLASQISRVVPPGGALVLRLFVPPAASECPADVVMELLAGRIRSLNLLKLRLGMALQTTPESGVAVAAVRDMVNTAAEGDLAQLAGRLGWAREHLLAINSYRESPNRYHFVTQEQAISLFEESFSVESVHVPAYELGERCPTVVFRRRGAQ